MPLNLVVLDLGKNFFFGSSIIEFFFFQLFYSISKSLDTTQLQRHQMDMKIPIPKGHPGRALKFELIAKCSRSKARAANMTLPHGIVSLTLPAIQMF